QHCQLGRIKSSRYEKKARESSTVRVWDAQTGQLLLSLEGAGESVTFSPDGKRLPSLSITQRAGERGPKTRYTTEKGWDEQTGQLLLTLKGVILRGFASNFVVFSPDGKRLAKASNDKTVQVWDAQTGQELLSLKGAGDFFTFSPDGKCLASAG